MANCPSPNTRKRGRQTSKLSVRLFLLDPDKDITKATKEIGSKKAINLFKQKGCGPPPPGNQMRLIYLINQSNAY
jgi:hypothetical protein